MLLTVLLSGRAEHLPVRLYTTADGLPRDDVYRVKLDSRGFLWVFTNDGFSRFDGYSFTNYTTDDGLPDRRVNDLLETRGGVYWLATSGGLCRFNPHGAPRTRRKQEATRAQSANDGATDEPMFTVYNPGDNQQATAFNVLLEDDAGAVWCGTDHGLYQIQETNGRVEFRFVDLGMPTRSRHDAEVNAIAEDRRGDLWIGTETSGLYRCWADGHVERYTEQQGLPDNTIKSLLVTDDGSLWVGTGGGGLCRLVSEPAPDLPAVDRVYTMKDGLLQDWIASLYQTRDGRLWAGTIRGLCLFVPSAGKGEPAFRAYTEQNGLCDREIWSLTEDRDGNLWAATRCGLIKVARRGFTTYGVSDGLGHRDINSIFENRDGDLLVINSTIVGSVMRGRIMIATPPPQRWWFPPNGL